MHLHEKKSAQDLWYNEPRIHFMPFLLDKRWKMYTVIFIQLRRCQAQGDKRVLKSNKPVHMI